MPLTLSQIIPGINPSCQRLLALYLTKNKIAPKAYAMDINKGPIDRATENIHMEELQDKIKAIQSNGMEKLEPGMVQSVVIAGMGGELMIDIIKKFSGYRNA